MKYLVFLFFGFAVFAQTINESLVQIHAALVPKIFLMDYNAKQKCQTKPIAIVVHYNQEQHKYALALKDQVLQRYSQGIQECTVEVSLLLYGHKPKSTAQIHYLFPGTPQKIKEVLAYAARYEAMSFAYNPKDLALGAMVSVKIGTKVKPILNLEAIKANNFTFRPVLLEISEIFTHQGSTP